MKTCDVLETVARQAQTKLTQARTAVVLDYPFWGRLVCKLELVPDATCATGWTDGRTIGFNPAFIANLPLEQVKFFVAHEAAHCLLQHHKRRDGRNPQDWNIAADYAINELLTRDGFQMIPGGLLDPNLFELSTEAIFENLFVNPPQPQPQPSDDASDASDASDGSDDASDDASDGSDDASDGSDDASDGSDDASDDASDGSDDASDDASDGSDDATTDPGGCGEVRDAPPDLPVDDWKIAAQQAATYADGCGKLSAGCKRLVKDLVAPLVNCWDRLRDFVDAQAKSDYSWRRPATRHLWRDAYLPSLSNPELAPVLVCVDTSGSVNQNTLREFLSQLGALLEYWDTSAHVIFCDYDVRAEFDIDASNWQDIEPSGGGGTRFRPAFQAAENWVLETGIRPSVLVYFTDLKCNDFPDAPPDYPVLWAKYGNGSYGVADPPFGEVLPLE